MASPNRSPMATVGIVAGLLASLALTLWLLSRVDWSAALAALLDIPAWTMALATGLSAVSYLGLAGYDVIAVRACPGLRIPPATAGQGGAIAFGISNFLGFPWITGAAVRQRIYRLSLADAGALVTIVSSGWLAFWLVVGLVCGAALALAQVPAEALPPALQPLAGAALLAVGGGILLALREGHVVTVLGREIRLLSRRLTLRQMACAVIDLAASALVLFVLLPDEIRGPFLAFLGLFVVAVGLGVLSHIPAGVGSFEAVMILGLQAGPGPGLTAGLLAYRMLRTVLPFLIASLALLVVEARPLPRTKVATE